MPYPIAQLNQLDEASFVDVLGGVFEQTPAIARQAWQRRPFATAAELHQQMAALVLAMDQTAQLALIRAHPELGGRVAMAPASVQEQAGAGLDCLSAAEFEQFQTLNQRYQKRFGFPFIVAVKNHTKSSILAAFTHRLNHSMEAEIEQALAEIIQIAQFRLCDLVED